MNSLRRARRRPRHSSVCFRSLWYVLIREAFLETLNMPTALRPDSTLRYELARADDASIRRRWETHCLRQRIDGRELFCPVHGYCHGCAATQAHRITPR